MRTLFIIFMLTFAIGVSAQSPLVVRSFDEGTKLANSLEFEKASGKFQAALRIAKTEQTSDDFLARLHFNLGVCEYQLDRPSGAIREYNRAITLKRGDYPKASYALGMAELSRSKFPAARHALLNAVASNKTDGEAWFDLAFAYLGEKDLTNAETAFRNSILYKSTDAALSHNNLGVLLAFGGDFLSAIEEFEKAITQSNGRLTVAKTNLDFCRLRSGNSAKLIAKLEFSHRPKASY